MKYVGIICIVLTLVNKVELNPVVNVPASSALQESNFEPVARITRPIELRPQSWDSYTPEVTKVDTRFRTAVPSFRTSLRDSTLAGLTTPAGEIGADISNSKLYKPVTLQPSSHNFGFKPTTQPPSPTSAPFTKAPEIDRMPFNIRLRPRSDHQIGPPNSTVFVFGDGFMKPIDQREFTVPRFNPLFFLRSALRESPQPLKLKVVRELPYFRFFAPGMERLLAQMKAEHRRIRRSPLHRVKRHHTAVLQNVLGQLQNFALVPIRSSSGRTNYILLRNPKFVIGGNVVSPTPPAAPVPTIIQISQPTAKPAQNVVFQPSVVIPSRQTSSGHVGRNSRPQSAHVAQPVATATSVDYHLKGQDQAHHVPVHPKTRQQPVAILGGRDTPDFIDMARTSPIRNIPPSVAPNIARDIHDVAPLSPQTLSGGGGGGYRGIGSRGGMPGVNGRNGIGSEGRVANSGTGGGGDVGAVQKTEVVETVVETQQHQQAAAAGSQAASTATGVASSMVANGTQGSGSVGALTDTISAQTAQTASAGSASAVKQGKKVVTKKTTTTKLKGDGAGGAIKEVSQVVEQSVHKDTAVASADTAATSVGVASGSSVAASDVSGVGNVGKSSNGAAVATGAASAVASSASSATASNTSVKSVKTIKKTTVTKTKIAKPGASIVMPKTVPSAMSVLAETGGNKASGIGKAKTAILSDNNDRRAIKKQPALIATQAPRKAARVVKQRRRRPKKTTTKKTPTTAEMEIEQEELTTTEAYGALGNTATPLPMQYGYTQRYPATNRPSGVAGWAGTTIEPALGPLDRINTTDVPEEIEPFPDKTPAEKRRELRKLARERARKAGLPPPKFVPAPPAPRRQNHGHTGHNVNHGHHRTTTFSSFNQVGPTATPSYGLTPARGATNAPPAGVAGWAGTTIEPALGPLDRINTTDVPEEIEARPDKTPAEKRRELRKMARERAAAAAKAKKQPTSKPAAKARPRPQQRQRQQQQPTQQQQQQPVQQRRGRRPGRTTMYPPVANDNGPQRQAPPRGRLGRNRGRNRNRGRSWGSNNRRRPDRRSREREEQSQPRFRDPFARWLYNNIDTEMVEKILPLWFLG